jgi:hypothetical protein
MKGNKVVGRVGRRVRKKETMRDRWCEFDQQVCQQKGGKKNGAKVERRAVSDDNQNQWRSMVLFRMN